LPNRPRKVRWFLTRIGKRHHGACPRGAMVGRYKPLHQNRFRFSPPPRPSGGAAEKNGEGVLARCVVANHRPADTGSAVALQGRRSSYRCPQFNGWTPTVKNRSFPATTAPVGWHALSGRGGQRNSLHHSPRPFRACHPTGRRRTLCILLSRSSCGKVGGDVDKLQEKKMSLVETG